MNYLQVNGTKTRAMTLGWVVLITHSINFLVDDMPIEIEPMLKILGVRRFYSATNSTGPTQRFLANHKNSSEQRIPSSFYQWTNQVSYLTNWMILRVKSFFSET